MGLAVEVWKVVTCGSGLTLLVLDCSLFAQLSGLLQWSMQSQLGLVGDWWAWLCIRYVPT